MSFNNIIDNYQMRLLYQSFKIEPPSQYEEFFFFWKIFKSCKQFTFPSILQFDSTCILICNNNLWEIINVNINQATIYIFLYYTLQGQQILYLQLMHGLTGNKHRVPNLNGSFTVWCHLCSKERCLFMPGVTIFEQPKSGYKKEARVRVYEEARRILVWGSRIN